MNTRRVYGPASFEGAPRGPFPVHANNRLSWLPQTTPAVRQPLPRANRCPTPTLPPVNFLLPRSTETRRRRVTQLGHIDYYRRIVTAGEWSQMAHIIIIYHRSGILTVTVFARIIVMCRRVFSNLTEPNRTWGV